MMCHDDGGQSSVSLTVWRQIDLALTGQEVVTLAFRLKLGGELLRRHLGEGDMARLRVLLLVDVSLHLIFF